MPASPEPVPSTPSGRDVIAQFLPASPFVVKLGIVADRLEEDEVRLRLPWDPSNVTIGDMVHGGAIATLADLTVMAAAWCGVQAPPELRGVTVSITLDFMAPARATDLIGVGRVLRRGRSLVNCEAEIVDLQGTLVAKALATYKVG
ncbi:thioesterase [Mycobacterium sp. 852002-51971_SCH5477799-a]|uniref:PaaI family thioesterase n=1 Tax=Mycobacterium sp. 852002-51971_SCH5477799-a TaxID=1834106 RepID=UPI0008007E1E|nr:PaaI family thioesterase [Mycobacterium sp. 852002-51971_SCH5477799-a]OBF64610.1 thioesterase [Mycobacterium sp. 852002-51971_SCH5477799-a]